MERITKNEVMDILAHMNLSDDFMWGQLMKDPDSCRRVLSILMQRDVGEVRECVIQETLKVFFEGKGIRLDSRVINDINELYNSEMQNTPECVGKRSRYYHGMLDIDRLPPGKDYNYNDLPEAYVIFICTFDPFGEGLYKYTFRSVCEEKPDLRLNDGSYTIFFNTEYIPEKNNIPKDVAEFFNYIKNSTDEIAENASDSIKAIHKQIQDIRVNKELGGVFMTLLERDYRNRQEGEARGITIGEARGITIGEARGKVIAYWEDGKTVEEIAARFNMPEEEVEDIVNSLD